MSGLRVTSDERSGLVSQHPVAQLDYYTIWVKTAVRREKATDCSSVFETKRPLRGFRGQHQLRK
jgi:hypothetical protein